MIYLQALLALVFVFALLGFFYVICRRLQGGGIAAGKRIQIVESVSLGEKRSLHLVRLGGQVYFLGATAQNLSLLGTLESAPEEVGERTSPTPLLKLAARVASYGRKSQ
jgi:flagellar biosynthetic protein FliO